MECFARLFINPMPSFISFARQTRNCASYNRIIVSHSGPPLGRTSYSTQIVRSHAQDEVWKTQLFSLSLPVVAHDEAGGLLLSCPRCWEATSAHEINQCLNIRMRR